MGYILPTIDQVAFTVTAEREDTPVRGNALASGDDAADRAAEDAILAELNAGNVWAWCTVRVRAEYRGFVGDDHLGCCSYDSEAAFREPGDYFDDMKKAAFYHLLDAMRDAAKRLGCEAI